MRKFLLFAFITCLSLYSSVNAEVFKGKALDEISTTAPKDTISVYVLKNISLSDGTDLKKGYIVTGKMLNITEPGEWHHNASFTFIPESYTDSNGVKHVITKEIKATYRQKMQPDYKHSEITVGNAFFSPSYVDNTKKILNGEAKEVWDDYSNRTTPWGKGEQIDIKPNEVIYFNFPD